MSEAQMPGNQNHRWQLSITCRARDLAVAMRVEDRKVEGLRSVCTDPATRAKLFHGSVPGLADIDAAASRDSQAGGHPRLRSMYREETARTVSPAVSHRKRVWFERTIYDSHTQNGVDATYLKMDDHVRLHRPYNYFDASRSWSNFEVYPTPCYKTRSNLSNANASA